MTRNGTCAICRKPLPKGTRVFFDSTKAQGSHLVHEKCWLDLCEKRDYRPPRGKKVQSKEPLDPPF